MKVRLVYIDGRPNQVFDSLQEAIAGVALAHENVEFTPISVERGVRVHIGPLTFAHIEPMRRGAN